MSAMEGAVCEQYDYFMEVPCRWDSLFLFLYCAVILLSGLILYATHKKG